MGASILAMLQIIRNASSRSRQARQGTIKFSSVEPRRLKYQLDVVAPPRLREHLVVFVADDSDDSLLMESGGECPGNHWVAPRPAIKVSTVRLETNEILSSSTTMKLGK